MGRTKTHKYAYIPLLAADVATPSIPLLAADVLHVLSNHSVAILAQAGLVSSATCRMGTLSNWKPFSRCLLFFGGLVWGPIPPPILRPRDTTWESTLIIFWKRLWKRFGKGAISRLFVRHFVGPQKNDTPLDRFSVFSCCLQPCFLPLARRSS